MINPTIWQLSDALGAARLSIAMVGTITAMAVWLIVAHHLWERVSSDAPYEREEVVLFNAATVATLVIGVGCM